MTEEFFFLDTNVVSHLRAEHIASPFFLERCLIPAEVFHESDGRAELRPIVYAVTEAVLTALGDVMASLEPGDLSLINLYRNAGNADPMLVACALVETRKAEHMLVAPTFVVVSHDGAVRDKCRDFGIPSMARGDFLARMASENQTKDR